MKVLTIVNDLGRGGTQRVAVDVALCYHTHGHESAVLTRKGSGPREQDLIDAGITVFNAQEESTAPDTSWNTQARDWMPDVIHFHRVGHHDPIENTLIEFLKDNRGDQVKVIEHSHFGRCDRSPGRELIDAHIQISKFCLWRWSKWARWLPNKPLGVFIPHMVHTDAFAAADPQSAAQLRDEHNIPQDAFVYGFLAQPHRAKWSPVLFNSFKAVAQRDPSVYLMIAGISEESKSLFADFPQDIKSRIIVLPFINGDQALRAVYSAMDTFVHTTRIGETFGFILTESMCCDTPVATMENPTRDNAQAEVVGHKRGGLVAANPAALVQAMEMLRDDPALRDHCKREGRQFVIDTFNKERVSAMLIKLLEHVHESKNKSELASRINADPALVTHISKSDLTEASNGHLGSYTLKDRITQCVVLNPIFQWFWQRRKK